jgi:helicase
VSASARIISSGVGAMSSANAPRTDSVPCSTVIASGRAARCGRGRQGPLDTGRWPSKVTVRPTWPGGTGQNGSVSGIEWLKVTDPAAKPPLVPPDTDLRVLLPDTEDFAAAAAEFSAAGAQVRRVKYLLEDEAISASREHREVISRVCGLSIPYRGTYTKATGSAVAAARDAFALMWQDAEPFGPPPAEEASEAKASEAKASQARASEAETSAAAVVTEELAPFLPYRTLNQAQAEVVPEILGHDRNLLVVAPTGAGKTVMGMVAALRAVVQQGRKAAWLVPQRSLADELDGELASWRARGLRVERLSGEYATDMTRIKDADMWVATTEKFEALCRSAALRESLGDVGVVVVDEIHMLGDATRGPVLEALLTRIRGGAAETRIVGLSATVSNAEQVAEWLGADLIRSSWRPTRLTWQLPVIGADADFVAAEAARTRLASAIAGLVTRDGGSVIVFCGSKRNVRRTALVIAASRGVNISGVQQTDTRRLEQICREARIGLHYAGWEHRREAERAFRKREADVLIATSTVAAGVNLPARAVIIADTQIGLETLDVATVQQMFGRAGRVGAGEDRGWAFMITDERERAGWQAKLVAGHAVRSQILGSLPDHVLGEAVQQQRHTFLTASEAEQWWVHTLAYHQGRRSTAALNQAVGFLSSAQMLTVEAGGERRLKPTELGRMTARLMVAPVEGDRLRHALFDAGVPASARQAEAVLAGALATAMPELARARVGEDAKSALARLLESYDRAADAGSNGGQQGSGKQGSGKQGTGQQGTGQQRGDLARAALLTVVNAPGASPPAVRQIGGVPYPAMYQVLVEAPRYLSWVAGQGQFGTIHPCWAIVAADLELRIAWRMLQPPRGSGRLLWACEQMATPAHAAQVVPQLWRAARARGHAGPDWPGNAPPAGCRLDADEYLAFLRNRATGAAIEIADGMVTARAPAGSVLAVWTGSRYQVTPVARGPVVVPLPPPDPADRARGWTGAAIFTRRDDYRGTGWLAAYSRVQDQDQAPNQDQDRGMEREVVTPAGD